MGPWHCEKFSMGVLSNLFLSSLLTQKSPFRAILAKSEPMFLRKIQLFVYPFGPKTASFLAPRALF